SISSRGVLASLAGGTIRFSRWKGLRKRPTTAGCGGVSMRTSEDCAKTAGARRTAVKRPGALIEAPEVQLHLQAQTDSSQQLRLGEVFVFETGCPVSKLLLRRTALQLEPGAEERQERRDHQ